MHHASRNITLAIAPAALVAAACEAVGPEGDDDLDPMLAELLAQKGGAEAFLLPAETGFDAIPQDPRNPLTVEKVHLGKLLFHETALATDAVRPDGAGTYSCATCHAAGAGFEASVREMIEYKNRAIPENRYVSEHRISPQIRPLRLSEQDVRDLTAVLERGLRDPALERYVPRELPSGRCFPANDRQSRLDLGCAAPGGGSAENEIHPGAGLRTPRAHGAVPYSPLLSTIRGELP